MISDNVEEALSGVKGENTVKVFGPDLRVNEAKADEIVDVMATVKGIEGPRALPLDRAAERQDHARPRPCARYGLNTGDVEAVVQAAIGGQAVTQVYEGEKRFDLTVRWAPAFRKDLKAIREITVATPDGAQVPLGQLAQIAEEDGPSLIYREDDRRYAPVKFSVRGRDLASTIAEAREKIAEKVQLPYDTHLEWGGEINELNEATGRLTIIIPLTLLLITFLVYIVGEELARHADRPGRHPGRLHGRHPRAARHGHPLLGVGGDGLHLDLRHRHPGRDPRRHLRAAALGRRARPRRGRRARRPSSACGRSS